MKDLMADLEDVASIAADIMAQRWVGLVEKILALAKNLYETVVCFQNVSINKLQDLIGALMRFLQADGDQKQCILDHLKDAIKYVQKALSDALAGDTDNLSQDFQKIMDDLNYALNQC